MSRTASQPDHPSYDIAGGLDVLNELEKGNGPSVEANEETIMLPGDTGGSTRVAVLLSKKSLQDLRELCRGFNLKSTGAKPVLADQLREFSSRPELWKAQLNPGARKPHLGPHKANASRKTSAKASMQRRDEMFGGANLVKAGSVQPQLPTARVDTRTSQQKVNFLAWARKNVERHAAEAAAELTAQRQVACPSAPSSALFWCEPALSSTQASALPALSILPPAPPPTATPPAALLPATTPLPATLPSPPLAATAQSAVQAGIGSLRSLPAAPVLSHLQPIEDRDHTLRLGSGVVLRFRMSEIPDSSPVPILSKDLSRLGKIWDDTHPSWDPSLASLSICGHPIALKYWQAVYRRDPKGRWNNIKKYWHNWKMIAERWHRSTPENFWTEFTDENGKQKSYTQILEALREQHKQDCLLIAASAQEEYGDDFFSNFSYHKKGKRIAMTDPRAVSRHYKRCKAL